jgi:hypothetical protein
MINPATSELITVIANIALALTLVVGVVFGIAQVRAAALDRRERLTLEALHQFQSREFAELMHYIINKELPKTLDELRACPAQEQIMFMQLSQQMESLGMLVAERLINIDLVDKTLGSFVVTSWEKYKVTFMDIREKTPDPYLGEYFQWLAERIDERMKKHPRKAFYATLAATGHRK